jgi:CubicO group peptidase (beta-lactamase class C family)
MTSIDDQAVRQLLERCRREVDEGLLPSVQVALAFEGELVACEVFGDATAETSYCLYSATKAIVASAMWVLIGDGLLDVSRRVSDYLPEFAENGKQDVTVEQVMLHTSGFPYAPLGPGTWATREARLDRMRTWTLAWEPGTRYEYHATSAHWVQAELIHRLTGIDHREYIHQRITGPAGLPRLVGVPLDQQTNCATACLVGEPAPPEEIEATFGVRQLPGRDFIEELFLWFNEPEARAVGVPGAGGFGRAADLALFYQQLLHDPKGIWRADVLADATSRVRNRLPDPAGVPANRSLGLLLAGDDGWSHARGLGRTVSPEAFGHNGAGGQLAWADPATGLSLGYTTNAFDRHEVRQPKRGTSIGSLAARCATS